MIETKVAAPSAAGIVLAALSLGAVFGVDLSETQRAAILALVVAMLPLVHLLLGYLAPHTARALTPGALVVVPALPVASGSLTGQAGLRPTPMPAAPDRSDFDGR